MLKISFNKQRAAAQATQLPEGRHIGIVTQIAGLGEQPGFKSGDVSYPAIGVVVQTAHGNIGKKMRISDSPLSALYSFLDAALPDPDGYDGDDPLPLCLGRPVAIEVVQKNKFANIDQFSRPEDFELNDLPGVAEGDCLYLEGPEAIAGDAGKAMFLKLHRDIRTWLSRRVRGAS